MIPSEVVEQGDPLFNITKKTMTLETEKAISNIDGISQRVYRPDFYNVEFLWKDATPKSLTLLRLEEKHGPIFRKAEELVGVDLQLLYRTVRGKLIYAAQGDIAEKSLAQFVTSTEACELVTYPHFQGESSIGFVYSWPEPVFGKYKKPLLGDCKGRDELAFTEKSLPCDPFKGIVIGINIAATLDEVAASLRAENRAGLLMKNSRYGYLPRMREIMHYYLLESVLHELLHHLLKATGTGWKLQKRKEGDIESYINEFTGRMMDVGEKGDLGELLWHLLYKTRHVTAFDYL